MRLHWHRSDLRVRDNRGLAAGTADAPVLGLFVVDHRIHKYASPPRIAFVLDALHHLRSAYRERGGELRVREGDPVEIVPAVAAAVDATNVSATADYSGLAVRRGNRREGPQRGRHLNL